MPTTIKLNADQLDGEVTVAYGFQNGPRVDKPKAEGAIPQEYRNIVFNSRVFRIPESVYQQLIKSELYDMTLTETTFQREKEDGEMENVDGYSYSGSRTTQQVINRKMANAKISMIETVTPENFKLTADVLEASKAF